jgi:hypothetical protein
LEARLEVRFEARNASYLGPVALRSYTAAQRGTVKREIIIVENFYSDPDAVVRYARKLEYVYPYQQPGTPKAGGRVTWRTSRYRRARDCPFKSSKALIARLEQITGETIDFEAWNWEFPVGPQGYPVNGHAELKEKSAWWHCCFHAKHDTGQALGAGVHSHTDKDGWNPVGLDGWAGLIYLNKDPPNDQGGLRTWINKDPAKRYDWMTPKENWVLQDTLANVYNRLILHRGNIPHSGSNGWGNSLATGRFFQTLFFRTKARQEMDSLALGDLSL